MKQGKKPSLFKQHANKLKNRSENGFPEAIELPKEEPKPEKSLPQPANVKASAPGLLASMSQQGLVGAGEMEDISRKNWEQIDAMSPEERQRMVDMIRTQLPKGFVAQLEQQLTESNGQEEEKKKMTEEEQLEQQHMPEEDWHKSLRLKIEDSTLHWSEEET